MPKSWMSVSEASETTGIPKRTLIHAIQTERLEAHKAPGRTAAYVIDRADLDAYVAARDSQEATA